MKPWLRQWAGSGLIVMAVAAGVAGWAKPSRAIDIDQAIEVIAQHMVTNATLKPPRNNVAVIQFTPTIGEPRRLGDYLVQKIAIRMFELDPQHKVNFVSQGRVTEFLINEGVNLQSGLFDNARRIQMGKLLTADHFILGNYEVFRNRSVEVVSQMIDVETGLILAQKVVTADSLPEHLLAPAGSISMGAVAGRGGDRPGAVKKNPEAEKKGRMADLFEQRGRTDQSERLNAEILKDYPESPQAWTIRARILIRAMERLTKERRVDPGTAAVLPTIPPEALDPVLYRDLQTHARNWMVELGNRALLAGNVEDAQQYYERARTYGLTQAELAVFRDSIKERLQLVRADTIREQIKLGRRDQAETAIVEWEAEQPDSQPMKIIKKEFERKDNMVTISGATAPDGKFVDPFNLDIYETTNKEFLEFVKANPSFRRSLLPKGWNDASYLLHWRGDFEFDSDIANVPLIFASMRVGAAYCKWRGKRLPSNDEWAVAAGEGRRKYPWGDDEPTEAHANFNKGLFGKAKPGDAFPLGRTPEGVFNMAGNVWEYTSTLLDGRTMARGGSYYDAAGMLRSDYHGVFTTNDPTYSSRFSGFRCAQ